MVEPWLMSPTPVVMADVAAETASDRRPGALVIDWERRGKHHRQRIALSLLGSATSISTDDELTLERTRRMWSGPIVCRTNSIDHGGADDIRAAADLGADRVLVPMVRDAAHIESVLEVGRRCGVGVGVMIETVEAVESASSIASLAVDFAYVGLMDLAIARRTRSIFEPMRDGTLESLASALDGISFGVGGLTRPGGGRPIPTALLAAEIVRVGASFSFMRRSFHADLAGDPPGAVIVEIRREPDRLRLRSGDEIGRDRRLLLERLATLDQSARIDGPA
jgi:hypothetical protein